MRFNEFGEYVATGSGEKCPENCRSCLMVCPFSNSTENEDILTKRVFGGISGIKHRPETGYYLDSFAGYSNVDAHRASGASGGLATWMLETLLKTGEVDHVACVSHAKEPDRLFKFVMCDVPEEVRECSKSCYYPVGTCRILEEIIAKEGRYVITGLPCTIRAIREATLLNKKLRKRIKFLLGLTCGQEKSKFFAEYLCSLARGNPSQLREITFRVKDYSRCAADFGARMVWQDRKKGDIHSDVVFWTDGMDKAWMRHYFTLNSCDYCDDVFSEAADITFMDAWLPEYVADAGGTDFVITRNPELTELLQKGVESNQIKLDAVDIQSVIRSQQGVLNVKRDGLAKRLVLAAKLGQDIHCTRVIAPERIERFELIKLYIQRQITRKSKIAFKKQKAHGRGLKFFWLKMEPWIILDWLVQKTKQRWIKIRRIFESSVRGSG